jgi:hypothetical protein
VLLLLVGQLEVFGFPALLLFKLPLQQLKLLELMKKIGRFLHHEVVVVKALTLALALRAEALERRDNLLVLPLLEFLDLGLLLELSLLLAELLGVVLLLLE